MLDELLPMGLSEGARRAGVEPLELVRLMVESDTVTPRLRVTAGQIETLVRVGGIEHGWWDGVALPSDSIPERAVVRAAIGMLASRAGAGPVRMDNLWRGRPLGEQSQIEDALNLLDEAGTVRIVNAPAGVQVQVDPAQIARLEAIASGSEDGGLGVLFQG